MSARMDMNNAFFKRKEDRNPKWRLIDANGKVLGRLATEVADILRGKDKAEYTPHTDAGDYVVIVNADKVVLTGNKWEDKIYQSYSGWVGGLKEKTAEQVKPEFVIEHAVLGMLPKNKLSRQIIKKLKVYAGEQHPHGAHMPAK
ncbi:MAG TPA: 50S ribosomal protein L13 [Candidatus Babeliales bacterium]|nr:50S ribosomal protein L13 [Candidatus Babeliales bacterium]